MAILDVTENFTGLGANDFIKDDGRISGGGGRFFDVLFDSTDDDANRPFMAKADSRVPQLGEAHPFDAWIYVLRRDSDVDADSPFLYHVTVHYQEVRNPLAERPIIEWLSAATNEPIDTDIDGNPILNSSDEPFDPPMTEDYDDLILRATYNLFAFNSIGAMNYKGAINIDYFLGFEPGQAKVMVYSGREIRAITGNYYVEVTLEIYFRSTGWKRKVIDQGFRVKGAITDDVQQYTKIKDDEGDPITEPVLLDGEGQRLAEDADVVRLEFWTKPELPFTTEFARIL